MLNFAGTVMKLPLLLKHALFLTMLLCLPLAATPVLAEEQDLQDTLRRLESLLEQQQQELQAQRRELAEQRALIQQLQQAQKPEPGQPESDRNEETPVSSVAAQTDPDKASAAPVEDQKSAGQQLAVSESVTTGSATDSGANTGQQQARAELAKREEDASRGIEADAQTAIQEDPSNTIYDLDFPGAWHLPGSTAAMKIGGYVNLALINSFDPMFATDRFIVGSIPPDGEDPVGAKSGTDVTANQTRINFEVREETSQGLLRAFVEGDFYGEGDTYRLRHAFGQFRWVLAGKSWSTLMDIDSRPEEVDFEGINGEILARQAQVRIFPTFGESMSFKLALEDPRTDVVNGFGAKGRGDLIASVDRLPLGQLGTWNSRVAFILRELVADEAGMTPGENPSGKTTGWGVTTSGRKSIPRWGENDFLLWQLTYGEGIGRYLNDLNSVGGGDAVFDPEGKLRALPVFGGYVSYRHVWPSNFLFLKKWKGVLRSNFTGSWVYIDNYDFEGDKNYKSTIRASANFIYLPTPNVQFGMELLWGRRTNKDNTDGTATQLQFSARYNF